MPKRVTSLQGLLRGRAMKGGEPHQLITRFGIIQQV